VGRCSRISADKPLRSPLKCPYFLVEENPTRFGAIRKEKSSKFLTPINIRHNLTETRSFTNEKQQSQNQIFRITAAFSVRIYREH
jgi:hypothetical protein